MSENNSPEITVKIKVDDSDLIKLEDRLQRIANLMKQMGLIEEDKIATSSWLSSIKFVADEGARPGARKIIDAGMYLGEKPAEYDPGISNVDLHTAINELKIAVVSHLLDIKNALLDIKHKPIH
ncbi:hypothetical protein [Arsenophonus sp.]|uniref:hypothetical protein n=1 Tax=Arsenophonus sp. TaxID=1872640 RepID=UPI003879696B